MSLVTMKKTVTQTTRLTLGLPINPHCGLETTQATATRPAMRNPERSIFRLKPLIGY